MKESVLCILSIMKSMLNLIGGSCTFVALFLSKAFNDCSLMCSPQSKIRIKFYFYHAYLCSYLHAYMHKVQKLIPVFLKREFVDRSLPKVARLPRPKPTRAHNTRLRRKKMDALEQENAQLHEQVTTFRAELDRVNALVEALVAAQNRPPTPQAPVISEIVSTPIPATHGSTPQQNMPEGYP